MYTRATFAAPLALLAAALLAHACVDSVTSGRRGPRAPALALEAVPIAGQQLYVQSGFTVNLFAEGLDQARTLALGPDGSVFVALSSTSNGEIVRLVDADGDGVAETRSTVLSGLSYPFGLAFRGDTMYFAEQNAVSRLDPGRTTPVTIVPNLPTGDHFTRTIAFGPDNRLYVAIGSSCNVCDDALPRAAVTRYNLDGSNPHTFATGLRNSVGLAFNPSTGELWANNNDRDNLGDDVPPEHLNILRDGKWYGWPQCYLPGQANPEYAGADCSAVEPPAITFQAHSAPLGLVFYTGTTFPSEYQGDAFMTYHGSWNRTQPTGAKVVRVRVASGRPSAIEDFVTGWQLADGSRWGRPVSLLVMPDGALLVSDDWGGRIWRVSYGQSQPVNTGDLDVTTATSGSDPDPDGYTVTVDGTQSQAIGTNGSVTFSGLTDGSHTVALSDVAGNCSVSGGPSRTVTVPAGGTDSTTFSVTCTATTTTGNLTVTASTSGSSQPSGYMVTVDGNQSQAIGTSSSVTFTNLSAGSHSVALTNVAGNCTVGGANPRSVTVPSGSTVTTTFSVNCTPATGDLTIATHTTGSGIPASYTLNASGPGGSTTQPIDPNTSVTFSGITSGDYTASLSDVPANCTLSGANPRTVTVPAGGTGSTTFSVTCSATTTTGNLNVTTSTMGSSQPSGYTVTVDQNQSQSQAIGANSSVTFTGLPAGSHSVALTNVAGNCTVGGANPRSVTVPSGSTVTTTFSVSCTPATGDLTIATHTTGSGIPASYTLNASGPGGSTTQPIDPNTSVTFSGITSGDYTASLSDVPANCTLSGANPRTVTVPAGGTGSTTFSVSCTPTTGSVTATTTTTGSSLDPDGYTVTVDRIQSQPIGINSSVTFTDLSATSHSVALSGVAGNCSVNGGTSRTVMVPAGGTVTASFSATCATPNQAPTVNAGSDQAVLLGAAYSLPDASFSDPDSNGPWSYTISWGDQSSSSGTTPSQGALSGTHNYLLPGTYQITVTVTDNQGASGSDSKVLTVGSLPALNRESGSP